MDYGIKISKSGFDISTNDPKELSLSSKYGSLFVIAKGKTTIDCNHDTGFGYHDGSKDITIPNVSVYPLAWAYVRDKNGWLRKTDVELFTDPDDSGFGSHNQVISDHINIKATFAAATTADVYYWVFDKGISDTTVVNTLDYGFKASKDGNDVKTAQLKDLAIHSSYLLPQIVLSGGGTVSCTTGDDSITITHNLGYSPTYLLYVQGVSDGLWYHSQIYALNVLSNRQLFTYTNNTQLKIRFIRTVGATTPAINYKYFLFKDI